MVCQQCMQRQANVQITQMVNNQKSVLYLCESCAGARQEMMTDFPFNMSNLLSSIMENIHGFAQTSTLEKFEKCDVCGMTYDEFKRVGKFGCGKCYDAFNTKLTPIFRRLQGSTRHTGKVPGNINAEKKAVKEVYNLKSLLDEAIKAEEYEKAAQIRDRIRSVENDPKGGGGAK